jgi:hypothetical protein
MEHPYAAKRGACDGVYVEHVALQSMHLWWQQARGAGFRGPAQSHDVESGGDKRCAQMLS